MAFTWYGFSIINTSFVCVECSFNCHFIWLMTRAMKKKRVVEERIKREEKNKIKDIVRLHTQCMIHWIFFYNFFSYFYYSLSLAPEFAVEQWSKFISYFILYTPIHSTLDTVCERHFVTILIPTSTDLFTFWCVPLTLFLFVYTEHWLNEYMTHSNGVDHCKFPSISQ